MLYDRRMVEHIVSKLDKAGKNPGEPDWDYVAGIYLGLPWITPETSFLEHFGAYGVHNADHDSDRAMNPTEYLRTRREFIVESLTHDTDLQIDF